MVVRFQQRSEKENAFPDTLSLKFLVLVRTTRALLT
jgi:hypothetical protein